MHQSWQSRSCAKGCPLMVQLPNPKGTLTGHHSTMITSQVKGTPEADDLGLSVSFERVRRHLRKDHRLLNRWETAPNPPAPPRTLHTPVGFWFGICRATHSSAIRAVNLQLNDKLVHETRQQTHHCNQVLSKGIYSYRILPCRRPGGAV